MDIATRIRQIGEATVAEFAERLLPPAVAWAKALAKSLGPGAAYVNFPGDGDPVLVQRSYPPSTLARLVAVKDHYDPGNLFRLNQNIQPSSPEGESS